MYVEASARVCCGDDSAPAESDTPPPGILTTRTLSTLKLTGFLGHTPTHACAAATARPRPGS